MTSHKILTNILPENCRKFPDKTCVKFENEELSYSELEHKTNQLANGFLSLNLKKGDRIAILSRNNLPFIEIYWAAAKIGLVVVPINFRLISKDVLYMVNDSGTKVVMAQEKFVPVIEPIIKNIPSVEYYIGIDFEQAQWKNYKDLFIGQSSQPPKVDIQEDDLISIMYTSGVTTLPKGVAISQKNWLSSTRIHADVLDIQKEDICLIVNPLFHVAATWPMLCHLYAGGSIVLLSDFDPERIIDTLEKDAITTFNTVPTIINELLQIPGIEKRNFSHLKWIGYGGATMPIELLMKGMRIFGNKFIGFYGLTESNGAVTCLLPNDHLIQDPMGNFLKIRSCGKAVKGIEVKIGDEFGEELPPGQLGEFMLKGETIINSYWKLPEITAQTIQNGWFETGDLGSVDEEGFFYFVDRKKDIIISGGENISSREVEDVIYKHPAVLEAIVIGVPDQKWGEAVKAIVVRKAGYEVSENEIIELCRQNIAGFKRPKSVDFVDFLPKTASGKIIKREIKEKYLKKSINVNVQQKR
jgi:acyl-CoA synthetase (AMP-forming)/AMP-acid ligase II